MAGSKGGWHAWRRVVVIAAGMLCLALWCGAVRAAGAPAGDADQDADQVTASEGSGKADEDLTVDELRKKREETGLQRDVDGLGGWTVVKMLGWVLLVTVGIWGAARLLKRYVPAAKGIFGAATMKVVGRTYLSPKQSILLVKVGKRMVMVGVTPTEIRALSEIRDEEELAEINRELAGAGKGGAKTFQEDLKEARKAYERGDGLLEGAKEDESSAGKTGAIEGIRQEMDSLSKKINLWRKSSD